eukprot:479528_1
MSSPKQELPRHVVDGLDSPLTPPPTHCKQTLPPIDVKILAASRPLSSPLITSNSFSDETHEVNLSLDVNDEELSLTSPLQGYYQTSPANSLHSMHSIDRSSPSSLLLHQSVTSYPNLPSLHINDSKTPEENILCALEPSPRQRQDTPIYCPRTHRPQLLRGATKSEPPFPSHNQYNTNVYKKIQHVKSSKSLHHNNLSNLHHITSQPPPMPSYYLHRTHKSRTPLHNHTKHQSMTINLHQRNPYQSAHSYAHKRRGHHVRFDTQPVQIVPPMVSKLIPKLRHEESHSGNQTQYTLNKAKKRKKAARQMQRSCTPQPVYSNADDRVRVMRDKEVLQMDEEIPIEKFLCALKKGYARIMTEDDQNEEYTQSARIARSVSVGNLAAYNTELLAEEEARQARKNKYRANKKRKKKKKRNRMHKSKTPNCKHKMKTLSPQRIIRSAKSAAEGSSSGTESDSSSMAGDLVCPPSNELLAPKKRSKRLTRSQTHENRDRGRSHHQQKMHETRGRSRSRASSTDEEDVVPPRVRSNYNYRRRRAPSQSPTIPEDQDVLDRDIDRDILNIGEDCSMSPSDLSTDSDLSSSSSTDHDCEIPKQTHENEVLPLLPVLNHAAKSMNDVRSSFGHKFKIIKNQTYDTEDTEDEEEQDEEDSNHLKLAIVDETESPPPRPPMMRARALSNESGSSSSCSSSSSSSSASSDWDEEVRAEEEEEEEARRKEEEEEESNSSELATSSDSEDNTNNAASDASTETENLTESESEPECEDKDKYYSLESRPQSTPFRSSKGTAVFLSQLKSYRSAIDVRGGAALHLNELINCNQSRTRSQYDSLLQSEAEAKDMTQHKESSGYDSYKHIQKRK